jgi:large-conductance mechanosensitive channel
MKDSNSDSKGTLGTLLILLTIFAMFLALRINSLPNFLNGQDLVDLSEHTQLLDSMIVPIVMGIALLIAGLITEGKSLRNIYFLSITPFVIEPKVLCFLNHLLVTIINILLTFTIIIILILYITKTYERKNEENGVCP